MLHCTGRLPEKDQVMRKSRMVESVTPTASFGKSPSAVIIRNTTYLPLHATAGKEGTLCRCSLPGECAFFKILLNSDHTNSNILHRLLLFSTGHL